MNDGEHEEEPLDLIEDMEIPEGEGAENEAPEGEEGDDLVIELEGEEGEEEEPPLVKTLRQEIRERDKRLKALETVAPVKIEVGPEPVWGDYGEEWEFDGAKFADAVTAWKDRKRQADNADADAAKAVEAQQADWQKVQTNYLTRKAALPIAPEKKDAAEKLLIDNLSQIQQSALLKYTDDPAKLAIALAGNSRALDKLAKEADPIRFIIMAREMEGKMTVNRKKPPAPESGTIVRGSAPVSADSGAKKLKQLEDEARKTGDRTALIDYKRKLNRKAA